MSLRTRISLLALLLSFAGYLLLREQAPVEWPASTDSPEAAERPARLVADEPVLDPSPRIAARPAEAPEPIRTRGDAQVSPTVPRQRVKGRIVDPRGIGVRGAELELNRHGGTLARWSTRLGHAVTDGEGRFEFRLAEPTDSELLLRVTAQWFHDLVDRSLPVPAGSDARVDLGDIELEASSGTSASARLIGWTDITLHGTITDTLMRPVDAARVMLVRTTSNTPSIDAALEPERVATSDAAGRFEITGLGRTVWEIRIERSGYAPLREDHSLLAMTDAVSVEVPFRMRRADQTAAGRVVDGNGQGVAGAKVVATSDDSGAQHRVEATCDASGGFVLEGITVGAYTAIAMADGWFPAPPQRLRGGEQDVQLTVLAGASLRGRVSGAGAPPRVDLFRIEGTYHAARLQRSTSAAADGSFAFDDVAPGTYRLRARSAGAADTDSAELTVLSGEVLDDIAIALHRGARVTGTVVDADGRPIAGAAVALVEPGFDPTAPLQSAFALQGLQDKHAVSGGDGRFALRGVAAGSYSIFVIGAAGSRVIDNVHCADGRQVDLGPIRVGGGGVIEGVARNTDGSPLRRVAILATHDDDAGTLRTTTDDDGRFRIAGATPGSWRVAVPPAPFFDANRLTAQARCVVADGRTVEVALTLLPRKP